jgi:hypothetical protein
MEIDPKKESVTRSCKAGTLLFVADFVNASPDVLDFACELAEKKTPIFSYRTSLIPSTPIRVLTHKWRLNSALTCLHRGREP